MITEKQLVTSPMLTWGKRAMLINERDSAIVLTSIHTGKSQAISPEAFALFLDEHPTATIEPGLDWEAEDEKEFRGQALGIVNH